MEINLGKYNKNEDFSRAYNKELKNIDISDNNDINDKFENSTNNTSIIKDNDMNLNILNENEVNKVMNDEAEVITNGTDKTESSALFEGENKEADNTFRSFGYTFSLWFDGYEPRIVIGPHCKYLLCK